MYLFKYSILIVLTIVGLVFLWKIVIPLIGLIILLGLLIRGYRYFSMKSYSAGKKEEKTTVYKIYKQEKD